MIFRVQIEKNTQRMVSFSMDVLSCFCHFEYVSVCKIGATVITFDDIPNAISSEDSIPSGYKGFSWTNGNYLNISTRPTTGYPIIRASGTYLAWFDATMTIQTLIANDTITLNSCIIGVGWFSPISLRINGYYNGLLKNTTTVAFPIRTPILQVFNWYGLNRIVFRANGSGLCMLEWIIYACWNG